jgi:single-strand DNA-binding protein
MSQTMTIIGNLADDPELRFTSGGKAVAEFTVMTSRSRRLDDGTWESVDVTGWRIKAWEKLGENVAESLTKGSAVIVIGTAAWRSWENKDGSKGGRIEITASDVAANLKKATAKISRDTSRQDTNAPTQPDPWNAPADDIPPF